MTAHSATNATQPTAQNRDFRQVARLALTVLDRLLTRALHQFDRHHDTDWTTELWPDAMVVTYGGDR